MAGLDTAGRKIAGLLGYNPGPGIYSRLERAIQEMPANVRVQELPGLLKRYKEGVPGWELRATDLDSVIAGRDVVPQDELLAAVRERSPVYTHREIILGGKPPTRPAAADGSEGDYDVPVAVYQLGKSKLGEGVSHRPPTYAEYGQGGKNYAELLLLQPGAQGKQFGSHWQPPSAVAHARYDTHGDALRINELQSDLGIHNRKMREADQNLIGDDAESVAMKDRRESDESYIARMREMGYGVQRAYGGGWTITSAANTLPFPLEDAWADILIKRLALEAARGGHRAIEVASPRAIADKVGGNIDNYEHFYGKVVPGAIERLGRKMGGIVDDTPRGVDPKILSLNEAEQALARGMQASREAQGLYVQALREQLPGIDIPRPGNSEAYVRHITDPMTAVAGDPNWAEAMRDSVALLHSSQTGRDLAEGMQFASSLMPQLMRKADEMRAGRAWDTATGNLYRSLWQRSKSLEPRRYIMSDEMRRRLIEGGVGASLLGGLAPADTEE